MPPSRLEGVDLADLELYQRGISHEIFAELRRSAPVARNRGGDGGFWSLLLHADVAAVNRDSRRFSSERRGIMMFDQTSLEAPDQPRMMIEIDPPRHTRYRRRDRDGRDRRALRVREPPRRREAARARRRPPAPRHRNGAALLRRRRAGPVAFGVRPLLPAPRRRRQRDHALGALRGRARVRAAPGAVDAPARAPPNEHVAFGAGGPHFCLGANLARLELRVMLDELLPCVARFRLAGPVVHAGSNFSNGILSLPLEITPAAGGL